MRHARAGELRYSELPPGHGNPPWIAPDLLERGASARGSLWIEGELNAMVSWLALRGSGWGVCGLGSAFGPLDWAWMQEARRPTALYLDPGRVGDKTFKAWLARSRLLGVALQRLEPPLGDWDACDHAEHCGLKALERRLLDLL